jgi:hypothetical protein
MQSTQKHSNTLHRQTRPTPPTGPTVDFKPHTIDGRGWGVSSRSVEKTEGGVHHSFLADPDTWVDDDRITCNMCQHMVNQRQQVNMPADHFDKIRRENHIANQWIFDIVKIKNGWARAEYMGWQCNGGQRSYIPIDIKHRCDNYKPKQAAVAFNVKEWWE